MESMWRCTKKKQDVFCTKKLPFEILLNLISYSRDSDCKNPESFYSMALWLLFELEERMHYKFTDVFFLVTIPIKHTDGTPTQFFSLILLDLNSTRECVDMNTLHFTDIFLTVLSLNLGQFTVPVRFSLKYAPPCGTFSI